MFVDIIRYFSNIDIIDVVAALRMRFNIHAQLVCKNTFAA